jgi:hypothetical protein
LHPDVVCAYRIDVGFLASDWQALGFLTGSDDDSPIGATRRSRFPPILRRSVVVLGTILIVPPSATASTAPARLLNGRQAEIQSLAGTARRIGFSPHARSGECLGVRSMLAERAD